MGECIAIHPFREGNGRTAFILGNLVLMQNDLLPLDVYDRRRGPGSLLRGVRSGPHSQGLPVPWPRSSKSGKTPRSPTGREAMARNERVNVKAILADPDLRRKLMVRTLQATQSREGIDTTEEQAEQAYYVVTESERAAFFALRSFRGANKNEMDARNGAFVRCLRDAAGGVRFDVARRDFGLVESSVLAFSNLQWFAPLARRFPQLVPQHGARQKRAEHHRDRTFRPSALGSGSRRFSPSLGDVRERGRLLPLLHRLGPRVRLDR